MHLDGNCVAVSSGIYRDKGIEKGKPFSWWERFTRRLTEAKRQVGVHRQAIDFDCALVLVFGTN